MRQTVEVWMRVICTAGIAAVAAACAGAPSQRPVKLGPVDAGTGSVEATRRALAGNWSLATLEMIGPDGNPTPVKARGTLTYDAFGGLIINGVIEDASRTNALVLNYSGRIVIDPVKHEFYPQEFESDKPIDPARMAAVSLDKVRRYELTADRFVVTYLDASGKATAVAAWTRPANR
jgi:hypothetical protein